LAEDTPPSSGSSAKEAILSKATGTFDVQVKNLGFHDDSAQLGRMSIDKTFHGDLEATTIGEMLAARTAVDGSAGYVAIERVTGKLHGKAGTFVLQHSGTMDRGKPSLSVSVVPDSGTDELKGLQGKLEILIADGKHSYVFEYSLAGQ
jgi:hypothetical protein